MFAVAKKFLFVYNANMKIVLLQDVKNIGRAGDVKDVSDGYARNFLLPQKMAEPATEEALKKVEELKTKKAEAEQADLEKTEALAEQMEGREIVIRAKEKDGRLFGSITAKAVAKELKKRNLPIDDKLIVLPEAIRETGEFDVKIELPHGIEATVRVIVESAE